MSWTSAENGYFSRIFVKFTAKSDTEKPPGNAGGQSVKKEGIPSSRRSNEKEKYSATVESDQGIHLFL